MKSIVYEKRSFVYHVSIFIVASLLLISCEEGGSGRWSKEWEEKYEVNQPSAMIMDVIGVRTGMVIGEIGAGNGRFAVRVAEMVGPEGLVYANDIDKKAIDFMHRRCQEEKIENIKIIHGEEIDPGFPDSTLDLVYLINTYEHLSDPVSLLRNTKSCLKPSGKLAVIAYDTKKLKDHRGHATPREVVLDQVTRAGYELTAMDTSLVYDNIYIFRVKR